MTRRQRTRSPGTFPGVDDDRTPLRDAQHGPARLYRPDHDGHLQPVALTVEAITGRCFEPPGRTMTYVVLEVSAGATGGDRLVGIGQTVRLEYRVPMTSTRQALVDYEMDVLGWLGSDLAVVEAWLARHELGMGREVHRVRLARARARSVSASPQAEATPRREGHGPGKRGSTVPGARSMAGDGRAKLWVTGSKRG